MSWLVCFILSLGTLALAIFAAVSSGAGHYKRGRFLTPFRILFVGLFLSAMFCLLPLCRTVLGRAPWFGFKAVLFAIHNTFQIFTIDADKSIIMENISSPYAWLDTAYSVYLSILFVTGPVMTFGFLVSFLKNLSSFARYTGKYFSDAYIFSELNDRSIALAEDLRRHHKGAAIIFTDVFETNDEISYELVERAHELRAICFKKDVLAINFSRHAKSAELMFFMIGKDETENIEQSLQIIRMYRERENTRLFVFSTRVEGELLLTKADKGRIRVRRINEVRSLIYRELYANGTALFRNAKECADGTKNIGAVIVGMGQQGTEMLRALTWYCQMDGYRVTIDAFDIDPASADRFTAFAPELMSDAFNGVDVPGEAAYRIRLHPGTDATTRTFADEISFLTDTTYVFISLGSDEVNIRTAAEMRVMFERMHIHPTIRTVVKSAAMRAALTGIENFKGQPYDIDFIGDVASSNTEDVIINSELEADALRRHLKWGKEEEFWQYEYNFRSSVASAIHLKARIACGIPGADKRDEDLTDEEAEIIKTLEHRRWNAYMRSEGYVYSGSPEKSSRNDLGRMHHDLIPYDMLSDAEKEKDRRVGTE